MSKSKFSKKDQSKSSHAQGSHRAPQKATSGMKERHAKPSPGKKGVAAKAPSQGKAAAPSKAPQKGWSAKGGSAHASSGATHGGSPAKAGGKVGKGGAAGGLASMPPRRLQKAVVIETKVTATVVVKGKSSGARVAGAERGASAGMASVLSHNFCREPHCESSVTTGRYCRLHYIKNWRKIRKKEQILREKKLDSYIEELVSKYQDKYIDAIRMDLSSEKDFARVAAELEIEEFSPSEDFDMDSETPAVEEIIDTGKRSDFDEEDDFSY